MVFIILTYFLMPLKYFFIVPLTIICGMIATILLNKKKGMNKNGQNVHRRQGETK